jgi:hypothetical protein
MTRRIPALISLIALLLLGATIWFAATGRGGCLDQWMPPGTPAEHECAAMRATNDVAAPWQKVTITLLGAGFVLLGSFLVWKVKGNRFGLVFCLAGMLFLFTGFAEAYTVHGLVEARVPGAMVLGVISEIVGGPIIFVPFAFFFLLYPNGSLPSPRWRAVAWAAILSGFTMVVTTTFGATHLRLARLHEHPLYVPAVADVRQPVEIAAMLVFLGAMLASIVSLVLRFRQARGVERQQIRWFASSATFIALVLVSGPIFWATPSLESLWGPVFVIAMATLPAAAAVAILRYRLYEIDLIINRALVYVLLTATLAAFYVGFVFALQNVLPLRADSDLAVAASTLAAAAMFRPLRTRIQAFIDRRFYRRKYDARRALDELARKLRNEVHLETVTADVNSILLNTVQPVHASLWVRGPTS